MNLSNQRLLGILVVVVIIAGALFTFRMAEAPAGMPGELDQALYPLYTGVSWSAPQATVSPDYGKVSYSSATAATGTMDIAAVSTPFAKYYRDKLTAAGWAQDMKREAGGPGAEISVYTKGGQFVVVSYQSVFSVKPKNAPAQCPCSVSLTLMSGTEATNTQQ